MKISIEDGEIRVDIGELLSQLTLEEKRELVDSLSIEEDLFKCVADQLIDGMTEGGSWMGHYSGSLVELERMRLVEKADGAAFKVLKYAIWDRQREEARREQMEAWAWKLFHAWPDDRWGSRPSTPECISAKGPSDQEVRDQLSAKDEGKSS